MTTALREILLLLGFQEDHQAMTDEQPGYWIDLGNIALQANQVLGRYWSPVFLITGTARNARSLKQVNFEMPLECPIEPAIALIVRGIGEEFEPEEPVPWFSLGKKWQDRLPKTGSGGSKTQ